MIVIAAVSFQLVNVKSTIDIKIEVMRLFLQHNENMETSSSNVSFKLTDRQFSEFVDWGNRFAYILRIELLNIHHHRYVYRTWFFSILINISSKKNKQVLNFSPLKFIPFSNRSEFIFMSFWLRVVLPKIADTPY